MFKTISREAWLKKTIIFFAVFAVTVSIWGGLYAGELTTQDDGETQDSDKQLQSVEAHKLAQERDIKPDVVPALMWQEAELTVQEQPEPETVLETPEVQADEDPQPEIPVEIPIPDYEPGIASLPGGFTYNENIPLSHELQHFTYQKCVERGIEYELVLAVMWRESRFKLDAVNLNSNGTQDSGVMQINDVNRGWLSEKHGIDDLMDPYQNIDAGTIMLSMFIKKYGEHDALMAYQYGESGMERKLDEGVVTNSQIEAVYNQRDYYRTFV